MRILKLNNSIFFANFNCFFRPNVMVLNATDFVWLYAQALKQESQEKYAFLVDDVTHRTLNASYKNTLTIMDNEDTSKLVSLKSRDNNVLFNHINNYMDKFIPAGIAQHLMNIIIGLKNDHMTLRLKIQEKFLQCKCLNLDLFYGLFLILCHFWCFYVKFCQ